MDREIYEKMPPWLLETWKRPGLDVITRMLSLITALRLTGAVPVGVPIYEVHADSFGLEPVDDGVVHISVGVLGVLCEIAGIEKRDYIAAEWEMDQKTAVELFRGGMDHRAIAGVLGRSSCTIVMAIEDAGLVSRGEIDD